MTQEKWSLFMSKWTNINLDIKSKLFVISCESYGMNHIIWLMQSKSVKNRNCLYFYFLSRQSEISTNQITGYGPIGIQTDTIHIQNFFLSVRWYSAWLDPYLPKIKKEKYHKNKMEGWKFPMSANSELASADLSEHRPHLTWLKLWSQAWIFFLFLHWQIKACWILDFACLGSSKFMYTLKRWKSAIFRRHWNGAIHGLDVV